MRPTPITQLPVYVRAGSIMPFGPDVQYSSEKAWDDLEIRVYPGANASFTLYEDEGDNYNYEKGAFSEICFKWNDAARQLTIDERKGSFKGMLQQRRFRIVLVDNKSGAGNLPMQGGKSVSYDGKAVSVSF
jgi:alpha-D-xyloside xylohydrolase